MRGGVRICEDTSTLLNHDQIHEYVVPYTRKLLQAFGGGWVHYCGDNPHLYEAIMDYIPEYYMINFGNPERHDLPAVIDECIEKGKTYYGGLPRDEAEDIRPYFERVLACTHGTGRGLIFGPDLSNVTNIAEAVRLWRTLQE